MQAYYNELPTDQADYMQEVEQDLKALEQEKLEDFKDSMAELAQILTENGLAYKIPELHKMYFMTYTEIKKFVVQWVIDGK